MLNEIQNLSNINKKNTKSDLILFKSNNIQFFENVSKSFGDLQVLNNLNIHK